MTCGDNANDAIVVEDLHYAYPDGTVALRGVSFTVKAGSRVAILGPNGAGKTTLLFHLNGLYLPQRGRVIVLGSEVQCKTRCRARSLVGLVFQDPDDQVFSPTVEEDVSFGPQNLGLSPEEVSSRTGRALAALGIEHLRERTPGKLSYGEKKKVALAGVLAMEPRIMMLDEPMAFLDPEGKRAMGQILQKLTEVGTTLLVATHDVDFAAEWADTVLILKDGALLASGPPDMLASSALMKKAGLEIPTVTRLFLELGGRPRFFQIPWNLKQAASLLKSLIDGAPTHKEVMRTCTYRTAFWT